MPRFILGFLAMFGMFLCSVSLAGAQATTLPCQPPAGTAGATAIVCFGFAGCPPGYIDRVGERARALSGGLSLNSPNAVRTFCSLATPAPVASGPAEAVPSAGAPSSVVGFTGVIPSVPGAVSLPLVTIANPGSTFLVSQNAILGPIITDSQGMTLYLRNGDSAGVSTCSGQCAKTWPPLQPAAGPLIAPPAATGTLSVISRDDGSQQVAYNGMPLHYFSGDLMPGDTKGQGLEGVWFVATP